MDQIKRFEELIAWQKARELCKQVYGVTRRPEFARDFGLSNQIQRSSVSVMSNIAEGFERNRLQEFHQFLSIAKGSCAELRAQLYVAKDVGYLDENQFLQLHRVAEEVRKIIGGLRASVERRNEENMIIKTQNSALRTRD